MIKRLRPRDYIIQVSQGRGLEVNWGVPWSVGFGFVRDPSTISLYLPHLVLTLWLHPL